MTQIKRVNTGYQPRPLQSRLHNSLLRFNVLVAHRRFGKTVFTINEALDQALRCKLVRPRYAYIAPQLKQSKAVAWDYLQAYARPIPRTEFNQAELRCDLPTGARIQLAGADNPDSLRGQYFDGVVLDEFGDMPPSLWTSVVRPALADRGGWAVFIGTPKGHNQFHELFEYARTSGDAEWFHAMFKASETGILPKGELDAARRLMSDDAYEQEFECSFSAAIQGAYYGRLFNDAEADNRITRVPYEPAKPVETWWDLGVGDSTVIWFAQRINAEIRLIDYYEMTGEGLAHYVKVLKEKPYVYSQHVAPHDIEVRELGTGKSRRETARELGIEFVVAPNLSVDDGIDAVRRLIPRCWFDAEKCKQGIESLRQYRKSYDERLKVFRATPLHDWTSHAADAFRYGAVSREPTTGWSKPVAYPKHHSSGII